MGDPRQCANEFVVIRDFTGVRQIPGTFCQINSFHQRFAYCETKNPSIIYRAELPPFNAIYSNNAGEWIGLRGSRLYGGQLEGPDSLLNGHEHQLKEPVTAFCLAYDWRILVVESPDKKIRTYRTDGMELIDEIDGVLFWSAITRRKDTPGVFVSTPERIFWVDIAEDGNLYPIRLKGGDQPNPERPAATSECHQWVMTNQYGWYPGAIYSRWRPMPGVKPTTPKPHKERIRRGWLNWANPEYEVAD